MPGELLDPHEVALNTVVSLSPHGTEPVGVWPPGHARMPRGATTARPYTYDWRAARGSPENTARVSADFVATTLREALSTVYRTQAHIAGYVLCRDGQVQARSPRVTKAGLEWVRSEGYEVMTTCMMADVDTPAHVPWTPEYTDAWREVWAGGAETGPLSTCGLYLSPKGLRLVQPLAVWLPVDEAQSRIHAWIELLVAAGVWDSVRAVKDWARLMRVPHHQRPTGPVRAPEVDLSRMVPIDAPPPSRALGKPRTRSLGARALRGEVVGHELEVCPPEWTAFADRAGATIARVGRDGEWRDLYLAFAGALAEAGCDPAAVPAVVARAHSVDQSYPEWEALLVDRMNCARGTVQLAVGGQGFSGRGVLGRRWPALEALFAEREERTQSGAELRVRAQLRAAGPSPMTLAAATARIERELAEVYDVLLLAGPPGLGKTEAVIRRARTLMAQGGGRIALAVPRNDLARQVYERALAAGVPAARFFGPLSHRTAEGKPTCIHHDIAEPLVSGGQSLDRLFCEPRGAEPCEHAATCPARRGWEGADEPVMVVAPHELLPQLSRAARKRGTIVVDEPPTVVETVTLSDLDIDAAVRFADAFAPSYRRAILPALHALQHLATQAGGEPVAVDAAIRSALGGVAPEVLSTVADPLDDVAAQGDAVLLSAMGAVSDNATTAAPPLTPMAAAQVRRSLARAREVGAASKVCLALWQALEVPPGVPPTLLRVDDRRAGQVSLTGARRRLVDVIRRDGPVVLTSADVQVDAPAVARVLGRAPRLVVLPVDDGAPVSRTIIVSGGATRTRWLPRGLPDLASGLLGAIRAAMAWVAGTPARSLAIFSWVAIEAILAVALGRPEGPEMARRFELPQRLLDEARREIGPILAAWPGGIALGHYQATRGLDHLKEFDASITLGDPRPNLGELRDAATWVGLGGDPLADQRAAAELEQAHGRLRLPRRTLPAWQAHVGAVLVEGWAGRAVAVQRLAGGRPATVAAMGAEEFGAARVASGLSARAFGQQLRITHTAVARYESGERSVPEDVACAVRLISGNRGPSGTETPRRGTTTGVSVPLNVAGRDGTRSGVFGSTSAQGVSVPPEGPAPTARALRRVRRINLGALTAPDGGTR